MLKTVFHFCWAGPCSIFMHPTIFRFKLASFHARSIYFYVLFPGHEQSLLFLSREVEIFGVITRALTAKSERGNPLKLHHWTFNISLNRSLPTSLKKTGEINPGEIWSHSILRHNRFVVNHGVGKSIQLANIKNEYIFYICIIPSLISISIGKVQQAEKY
jgi:hypothetical protein